MSLIQQLENIQQTHGELSAVIVREPEASSWCEPPILKTNPVAHTAWEHDRTCHVWTESSQYTNAMNDFCRLCHSLADLAIQSRDSAPESLREWIRPTMDSDVLRWLWFLGGFTTMKIPGRTPRAARKCWGLNGHFFDADKLESLRRNLPAVVSKNMPPDAECWMVHLNDVVQTSIDAVEFLTTIATDETVIPEDCFQTMAGSVVLKSDLTEESRTSGEWGTIFDWDAGRKTFNDKAKRGDILVVRDDKSKDSYPRYFLHRNGIENPLLRSSKIARDEKLKKAQKPGRGGNRKVKT